MSEASPRQTALVIAISEAFRKLTGGSPRVEDKAHVRNDDLADEILVALDAARWRFLPPMTDEQRKQVADLYVDGLLDALKAAE